MYKMIVCDLDETLISDDRSISKENIEAIRKADEMGIKFVVATGRGYNTVGVTLEILGLKDKEGEYVISFNGGAIVENKGNRVLRLEGLSFEVAEELYRRGLQYDVCIHVYTKDTVYVYRYWDDEREYLKNRIDAVEIFDENLDFLKGQDIIKILFVNTDYQYLRKIEEDFKDLTDQIDISYSSNRYIEFNHKGVNKGAGLKSLAELLGIKIEETIAIGDNFNDLSMIRAAGLGIGVQNTRPDMKPLCDYITTATNNESAVAEVINKFIFNKE